MERKHREKLPPCHVEHVTRCALSSALTLLLSIRGLIAALRIAQRAWWLIFDFEPLGVLWEAIFLAVVEGCMLFGNLLTILTAVGMLRFRFRHNPGGGRMLYRLMQLQKLLATLAAVFMLAVTGGAVFFTVHYRLPVMWVGGVSAVGIALFIAYWVQRMFHKNVARILVDINHSRRHGMFQRGGGVSCQIQTQSWLLAMLHLIPMAIVILWGVISVWFSGQLGQLLGKPIADRLIGELTSGVTSVFSMYGLELLEMGMTVGSFAVVALLYGRYMRAHDEKVPIHWHTRQAA